MPEHDPIQDLERFAMHDLATSPLPPSEVRRLGDRRRSRRRNAGLLAAAATVVVAIGVPFALTAGGDTKTENRIAGTPTPEPNQGVITYPGQGVLVVTEADTAKLTGTSQEFKTFIAGQAAKAATEGASCPDAAHGVTVEKYSSAGYAIGGYNACGGYGALWAVHDDQWQLGMGTQDAWDCTTLGYLGVPRSFAGECADEAGGFGPTEVDGIRLGMTEAQVRAAGGLVQGGSDGGCRPLLLPYQSPVSNRTDGWFSPSRGVVAIAARPGAKTPEKVGLGSPRAVVEAAYPQGSLENGYWVVPLAKDTEYQIGIEQDGTVGELMLVRTDQDCFG